MPRLGSLRFFSTVPSVLELAPCSKTKVSSLANGFRVASQDLGGETATVGVWIDAGSRFENDLTNGVAHFLEHATFKGTKNRTKTQLEVEFENLGAHLNAYTAREQTVYYAKVLRRDVDRAVEVLADLLQNALLTDASIEAERGVILREMEEIEKNMEEVTFDHLHAVAYQGTPLARTILGPRENVLALKRRDLADYVRCNYTGPRMVLVGAGAIDHSQLERLAERYFGSLSAQNTSVANRLHPTVYTGSDVVMRDDEMPDAHVAIAVEGVSWTDPDYWPLLVAQSAVGSWDRSLAGGANLSSRLASVVSENGLASSFLSFNTSYTDSGLFGIYFVSDHRYALDRVVDAIQSEWTRICLSIGEAEVTRAKNLLRTNLLLSLDGTTAVAEDIGRQMLTQQKRVCLDATFALIDQIDAAMVRRIASEYLYDRCPAVAAFGAVETLPDYTAIRAGTRSLRH